MGVTKRRRLYIWSLTGAHLGHMGSMLACVRTTGLYRRAT
jgi:hypothetical protein